MEIIELKLGTEEIIVRTNDGIGSKNIAISDLVNVINDEMVLTTGLMSPGIREYHRKKNVEDIVIEFAPRVRKVLYADSRGNKIKYSIPFPGLVFGFRLINESFRGGWCFATKEPLVNNDIMLYRFPFGNTRYGDGVICWGSSNNPSGKQDVKGVYSLIVRFLDSPFNSHWSEKSFKSTSVGVVTPHDLMKQINGTISFPFGILRKVFVYKNFKEKVNNSGY